MRKFYQKAVGAVVIFAMRAFCEIYVYSVCFVGEPFGAGYENLF